MLTLFETMYKFFNFYIICDIFHVQSLQNISFLVHSSNANDSKTPFAHIPSFIWDFLERGTAWSAGVQGSEMLEKCLNGPNTLERVEFTHGAF